MFFSLRRLTRHTLVVVVVLHFGAALLEAADLKVLPGQVPKAVAGLAASGRLAATNVLWLAISLPLRDRPGLEKLVAQVSDPASPNFRHFLTGEELTARFGPTQEDYEQVKKFAQSNGLAIAATHDNRLVLEVTGSAAAVEKAFHVTLRTYRHPAEARDFFAPDTEPMVDATLPIGGIEGLSNFSRPHSRRMDRHQQRGTPKNGSSPDGKGYIFGDDFRNAYVPGTTLTGAGQTVGVFEWDGSYSNAVAAYAKAAGGGRTNIVIQYVLIQGFNGKATSYGEPEVDMDIEMAMAMAPGLSKIVVFEGNPNIDSPISILNTMAASNSIKNLSCSWGWSYDDEAYTNTDAVFLEMAAQGQTFFNASGDSGAFTTGATSTNGVDNPAMYNAPSSDPYITQAGGTIMTMNGSGASWNSETVWDDGVDKQGDHFDNSASSGGVSSYYAIPSWQTNVSNLAGKGGSTSFRNIPDVAACADNIYEVLGKNAKGDDDGGGTSSAAPLWAGFMALVNQQLTAQGQPSAGFINPAVYALAAGPAYAACYHDVTSGSNIWSQSPTLFYAATNYDLCTGVGTMNGTNLINALAPPAPALLTSFSSSNGVTVSWNAMAGAAYQAQYNSDFRSTNWANWGAAVTGLGTNTQMTDASTNSQRFYRVMAWP